MMPRMSFNFDRLLHRKKKDDHGDIARNVNGLDLHCHSVVCNKKESMNPTRFTLRAHKRERNEEIKERKREMANKVANISGLIYRVVTSSCLTHHLPGSNGIHDGGDESIEDEEEIEVERDHESSTEGGGGEESSEILTINTWEEEKGAAVLARVREVETLMSEAFEAVSAVKRAYVSLQGAHSPWDPDRMRIADAAVVAELRRLGRLRDRFRRGAAGGGPAPAARPPIREVVAPYEAALEDLRRGLKAKEAEVEGLKEKLRSCSVTTPRGSGINGRKGRRLHYNKRVGCVTGLGIPPPAAAATPELFENCMDEVKSASKSFTAHLLTLMRSARWDIAAAARSIIEDSSAFGDDPDHHHSHGQISIPAVESSHAKHAMESYVTRRIFHGFENETFYIDGSLSSLLHPADFRRDCFAQFRDMRAMDPAEILGILPTCHFGKFAAKKYLCIVHPKMEESLFGGLEQRRQVLGGAHPRTGFYGEYLRLAKAVWLLHLVAFAMDPSPGHFEASRGAEFHPEYMESVVKYGGGRGPGSSGGLVVGFSVGPGFKLGNGSVVRARVYLVPRARDG